MALGIGSCFWKDIIITTFYEVFEEDSNVCYRRLN